MPDIIPVEYLNRELPEDATNENNALANAVTRASNLVNTWMPNYLPWDEYDEDSDDEFTLNVPDEIAHYTTEIAKTLYWMGVSQISRDGEEREKHQSWLNFYKAELATLEIEPVLNNVTVSLDSNGYQLIARNQNILTHNAYITSASTNIWNLGTHFFIVKGSVVDQDDYQHDGWYLDGSTYVDDLEGTLYYYRSYRRDTKDYMKSFKDSWGNN